MNDTTNNTIPTLSAQQAAWLQDSHLSCADSRLAVLKASGEGLDTYLQGQVTQDLGLLSVSRSLYCAILTPQGKAVSDFHIMQGADDERIIVAQASHAVKLVARLRQFALRMPLRIGVVSDMAVISVQGPQTNEALQQAELPVPADERLATASSSDDKVTAMRLPEAAVDGVRLILPSDRVDECMERLGDAVDVDCLEAARIIHGTPRFGVDWDEKVHPLNANLIEYGGVSFDKGCYVGQEVTSRMQWRGGIKKALYHLRLPAAPASLPFPLYLTANTAVAHVSSAACDSEGSCYGIAQLKIEDVDGGKVFRDADANPIEVVGRCSPA